MTITNTLLLIIASVALLLWGINMVRKSFTRAYGTSLRKMIEASTGNRFLALFSGIGATTILQSSSATTLLLSNFAGRGLITTSAAIAVVLGADIGTTLVAQILTFDLAWLMPVLLIAGILGNKIYKNGGRNKHLARAVIGIGLMLLSLTMLREAVEPLKSSPLLPQIIAPMENEWVLALAFSALLTWMIHSSLAAVLLFSSFTAAGILSFELGLVFILGANVGGALVPIFSTMSEDPKVRRIPAANMIMRLLGVMAMMPALTLLPQFDIAADRAMVLFHTAFNVLLALVFLPFTGLIGDIATKLIPNKDNQDDPARPKYLDKDAIETPVIALAGAARETLRMAEMVESMLEDTIICLRSNNDSLMKSVREKDDQIDKLYSAIKLYMTKVTHEELDPKESDRYIQILTYATNLEHIGDIIDTSLLEIAWKRMQRGEEFSEEGFKEIKDYHNQVLENMRLAQTIFLSEDPRLARDLIQGKKELRQAEIESSYSHFDRLRSGKKESLATSSMHLDILRDYRRINSYVTSIAYTILDNVKEHKDERKLLKE